MRQLFVFVSNAQLVRTLVEKEVRFIVVGGLAVHYYANERVVNDLDLLVEQTKENAQRLFSALAAENLTPHFSIDLISKPTDRPQQLPLKVIHYADLLTPGKAIDFATEWDKANIAQIDSYHVRIASRDLLLAMKRDTGRQRDIDDALLLQLGV